MHQSLAHNLTHFFLRTTLLAFLLLLPTLHSFEVRAATGTGVEWESKNKFLSNHHAPTHKEMELTENLKVVGTIPAEISGTYLRNGPNQRFKPASYYFPFDGDGMLHAVYIQNGKAAYRNKYVITKEFEEETKAQKSLYEFDKPSNRDDNPYAQIKNTSNRGIARVGNAIVSLADGMPGYVIDNDLNTIGEWVPDGANEPLIVNACHKIDPETGNVLMTGYRLDKAVQIFYTIGPQGQVINAIEVAKPHISVVHDFAVTKNYIIFFDAPLMFDMHNSPVVSWKPDRGMSMWIIDRNNSGCSTAPEVRQIPIEKPLLPYHIINGYEEGDDIVVEYVGYDRFPFERQPKGTFKNPSKPAMFRTIIDTRRFDEQGVKHNKVDDTMVEFPAINRGWSCKKHRYSYFAALTKWLWSMPQGFEFNAINKFDSFTGKWVSHNFSGSAICGEPVFIPKSDLGKGREEDDAWTGT